MLLRLISAELTIKKYIKLNDEKYKGIWEDHQIRR
jgi:hypothetical protein